MLYATVSPYIIGDTKTWLIRKVTPMRLEEEQSHEGEVVSFTKIKTRRYFKSQLQALIDAVNEGMSARDYLENHELIAVSYPDYIFGRMPSYTWVTEERYDDHLLVMDLPRGVLWLDLKRGASHSRLLQWSIKAPLVEVNGSKLIKGSVLRKELARYNCNYPISDKDDYIYAVEVPPSGSNHWRLEFVNVDTGQHHSGTVIRRKVKRRRR